MPAIGFNCNGQKLDFTACLAQEYHLEGNCILPYPLLALVAEHNQGSHAAYSVTTCLYCLCKAYFSSYVNYYLDAGQSLQATYGTCLHKAIEDCSLNRWEKEIRVKLPLDKFEISGIIDAMLELEEGGRAVVDFKFPAEPKREEYLDDYVKQIQMYSYMARGSGYDVRKAYLLIMPTSHKLNQIQQYEISLEEEELQETYEYIKERAELLYRAYEQQQPPPYYERDCKFCREEIKSVCQQYR